MCYTKIAPVSRRYYQDVFQSKYTEARDVCISVRRPLRLYTELAADKRKGGFRV